MKFDQAKSDVRFAANFSSSSFLAATALIFILSLVIGGGAELLHISTTVPFFLLVTPTYICTYSDKSFG